MIYNHQVEEILEALDHIEDREELKKFIKRKLEDAYDSGAQSTKDDF